MRRIPKLPVPGIPGSLAAALALALPAAAANPDAPTVVAKPSGEGGYRIESTLAIGGADAADEAYFYERFGSIEMDADRSGRIYVLDNGNVRIQVFDRDGRPLRSLGAEGDGPGEFRMMGRFSVNGPGDVAVLDLGQGRVTVLDAEGELVYDVPGNFGVEGVALLDDRTVLLSYGDVGPARVEAYGADGERIWAAGASRQPGVGRLVNIQLDRQTIAPRLGALPGGGAVRAPLGEYRVETYGPDGAGVAVLARPFERRKISADALAPPPGDDEEGGEPTVIMIRQEAGGGHGAGGGGGGARSWTAGDGDSEELTIQLDDVAQYMPEFHPDTRGLLAWPDGRVWIVTAEDGRGGTTTDEWTADGEWVRRFRIPSEYDRLAVGRDGNLYGVTHDEDDYPTVHRLAVSAD